MFTTYAVTVGDSLWNVIYSFAKENEYSIDAVLSEGEQNFAVLKDANDSYYRLDFSKDEENYNLAENVVAMEDYTPAAEAQFAAADVEAFEAEFVKKKDEEEDKEDKSEDSNSEDNTEDKDSEDDKKEDESKEDDKDEEDKKKKYSLEEIPEYVELSNQFSELENKYNALVEEKESLNSQVAELVEFKKATERKQKEDMINNQFFMLSDEDKADVMNNIDTYSLDDIEAKLSIICVRNKVNFAAFETDNDEQDNPITYNLGDVDSHEEATPAWVRAVLDTAKTLN